MILKRRFAGGRFKNHQNRPVDDLESLDRRILRDIGIGRGEILVASRLFSRIAKHTTTEDTKKV